MKTGIPGTVLWVAPIYNRSGFAVLSRAWVLALHRAGIQMRILNVGDVQPGVDDCDIELIRSFEQTPLEPPVTAVIAHVPNQAWLDMKLPEPSRRIIITTFDGDAPPKEWVSICNQMDQVWLSTENDRRRWTGNGLNPTLVRVMRDPHPWADSSPFPVAEASGRTDEGFRFLSIAVFLPRRRWDVLIQAYLEEFKGNARAELYLKVVYPKWHPVPGKPRQDLLDTIDRLRQASGSDARIIVDEELGSRTDIMRLVDSCDAYVSTDIMITAPVNESILRHRLVILTDEGSHYMPTEHMIVVTTDATRKMAVTDDMLAYLPTHRGVSWPILDVNQVRHAMRSVYEMTPSERQAKADAAAAAWGTQISEKVVVPQAVEAILAAWDGIIGQTEGTADKMVSTTDASTERQRNGTAVASPQRRQRFSLYHTEGNEESHKRWMAPYADIFKGRRHVLDLGCGPGVFLDLLRERGIQGTGLDFDPDMVAVCTEKGLHTEIGDVRTLSQDGQAFDGIHLGHIIEHMDGPSMIGLLEACLAVLEPDGLLLVRTPNWNNETVRNGGFWLDHTHVRPYPLELLDRVFQDLGLDVIAKGYEPEGWEDTYIVGRKRYVAEVRKLDTPSSRSNARPSTVVWEGAQFVHHSLALVNREMCLALAERGHELSIVPKGGSQFGPEADSRFGELEHRFGARLSRPADVHVRHAWPPDFDPPREGHWVMIQPWEFGSVPKLWIEKMRDQVDEVWAYTNFVKQCYVESGMPEQRVQVVPLGVDTVAFHPGVTPKKLATDKSFKFLFVGGTIARKGPDVLLSAYISAFHRQDDVCLVIKDMGVNTFYRGHTMVDQIRELQANADAPEILYLTEDLSAEEMPELYAACDCLVHPYRGEGFGLPIAEAMACGLPAIITGTGAALDFCDDRFGYLIPAEKGYMTGGSKRIDDWETVDRPFWYEPDAVALAGQMRHVFAHPDEAREKGARAARHIAERFTWAKAAEVAEDRLRVIAARPVRRYQQAAPTVLSSSVRRPIDCLLAGHGACHTSFWTSLASHTETPLRLTTTTGVSISDVHPNDGWSIRDTEATAVEALNRLLSEPGDDPVLLISSDVVVTPGWLSRLTDAFRRDETIAAVAPSSNRAPSPQKVKTRYVGTGKELRRFAFRRSQQYAGQAEEAPYLGAFCIAFDRSAYRQVGPLNEDLQLPEALWDYFDRVRQTSLRLVVAHDSYVHHEQLTEQEGAGFDDLADAQWAVSELLSRGGAAVEQGDLESAVLEFRRATESFPDLAAAHVALGSALTALGRVNDAVPPLQRAAALAPRVSTIHSQLGVALFQIGDLPGAEAAFHKACNVDSKDVQPLLSLIELCRSQERYEEATEHLKEALHLNPNHPEVLVAFGVLSLELGDAEGAEMAAQRLQSVDPQNPAIAIIQQRLDSLKATSAAEMVASAAVD